jgi:hypothetical protein
MNTKITPGKYQVTAARAGIEISRQGFDDPASANEAYMEALTRYLDCELRLTDGGTALISVGAAGRFRSLGQW